MGRKCREETDILGHENTLPRVGDHERADNDAVRAQRDRGSRGRLNTIDDFGRLGTRVTHELEMLPPGGTDDQPLVVSRDLAAAQRAQGPFGCGDLQRVSGSLADQREQRALGIEEANGIANDLLDDAVQLERVGQDV